MRVLFSPYQLGPLKLDNRIVIPPMCQYSANEGIPSDWHLMHYGALANSGAALLIYEATAILPEGRISPLDLGLWNDAQEAQFTKQLHSIKQYSTIKLGIQLAHAGRKASTGVPWKSDSQLSQKEGGWITKAPSAIAFGPDDIPPEPLTETEIKAHITAFADSAIRAERAGFDAIEIHGAHGYLLHEFLSPLSNHRHDQYGGSFENRIRFLIEVFEAIKQRVSSNIAVGVRISATDWIDDGWSLEESVKLAQILKTLGADFIHVSTGALALEQKIPVAPLYQVPFAREIKQRTHLTTIAVGLITNAAEAESILEKGDADLVAIGRGMLMNPHWGWNAAKELGLKPQTPPQYGAANSILRYL